MQYRARLIEIVKQNIEESIFPSLQTSTHVSGWQMLSRYDTDLKT